MFPIGTRVSHMDTLEIGTVEQSAERTSIVRINPVTRVIYLNSDLIYV